MTFSDNTLLTTAGVFYPSVLRDVKPGTHPLQPFWEAFTNSLEAIADLADKKDPGLITVKLHYNGDLLGGKTFERLIIEDTGIGFNDIELTRFLTYKDDRKGHNNRGSGRLQLIHGFGTCEYESIFKANENFYERKFHVSARPTYLKENAIAFLEHTRPSISTNTGTTLSLINIKNPKNALAFNIDLKNFKDQVVAHYIQYLCAHRESLPKIRMQSYVNGDLSESLEIESEDIPQVDMTDTMEIPYQKYDNVTRRFSQLSTKEFFTIKAFKIPSYQLDRNAIKLTSKDEIVENEEYKISMNVISSEDHIDKYRFLFLVSSPFIDNRDQDTRGNLRIYKRENFKKDAAFLDGEEIFLDDIEKASNDAILKMYDRIKSKTEEKLERIQELKKMFLLNEDLLEKITISVNDTEEKVLEKIYSLESKQMAKGDALIKMQMDNLTTLDPAAPDYQNKLSLLVDELVKAIPNQNRAALTHYVAKRKIVLDIYDKVLQKGLAVQTDGGRNKNEKLMHNILFGQGSSDTNNSDMWIISEDFIYFKGTSESTMMDLELDGVKVFKERLTPEEESFAKVLNLNKLKRRTDVLLFPQEGKCIILEYKAPDVNVADHLTEINNYAAVILNLSKPEFKFDTFYGYLIGEAIDPDEVRSSDSDFKHSYQFDYLFRPAKSVFGKFNGKDGSLYTEVIKYSTLWDRAKKRNQIFIDKLFLGMTGANKDIL